MVPDRTIKVVADVLRAAAAAGLARPTGPENAATLLVGALVLRLVRIAAHHYFHIGVVACQRDRMGHAVGDYPGLLVACL